MKYIIASDIHGSAYYAEKLLNILQSEKADKLVLLGDIYNHGPRNALPKDYSPMKVSQLLNSIVDKLIVIKGNCDSQVDTLISDFSFIDEMIITSLDKSVYLTHGHIYNKDNLPKVKVDALVYGHFHTGFIQKIDGLTVANAGSISLPKNQTPHSYLVLSNDELILKDDLGNIICKQTI